MQESPRQFTWIYSFPRVFVGLVLLATGTGKLLDMAGFVTVLDAYRLMPYWMNTALAYTLPFIELLIGCSLVVKANPSREAWGAIVLHLLMLTAVSITLQRGIPVDNCGCFGVFFARPLTIQTLFEDLFMLLMSFFALIIAKRANPVFVN